MSYNTRENMKLSLAFATLASVLQLACAKGDDPQAIQSAPPSALATHLRSCATKVTGAGGHVGQVVVREAVPVCRRNLDGSLQDLSIEPRFKMTHTSSRRIELQQTIALRLHVNSENPSENSSEKAPKRLLRDRKVLKFVNESCKPVLDQIFRRSGLRAEHQVRLFAEGEEFEPAGPIQREKPGKSEPARSRGFHLLLDLEYSPEKGVVLRDDPAAIASGPLAGEATIEAATDLAASQAQFCGQIAMRVAENYGLTKGRDCQSLSEAASGKTTAENPEAGASTSVEKSVAPHVGLMKPGRSVEDLKKVKLASDEIDEVFFPVCGKMAKTLHQR